MKSNLRNEIKSYIVRQGMTMQEVVDLLRDEHGWSDSVSNLPNKLQRESLRYVEAVQLADVLGYFDFTQEKILEIARTAHDLGIELFVMDDGWFGKRNCDNCSLGDWVVNREKLPDGLDGLSKRIHDLGMLFGLWMEPEMISPDSDLFRAHPDWCLHVKGRPSTLERSQLILDLSRAEVQDYVIEAVCRVLRESNAD